MRRAVALAAVVAGVLAAGACTDSGGSDSGGGATVFTTIDANHTIDPKAPINPYNQSSNASVGYNGMQLAWEKNTLVDDDKAFYPAVAKSWQVAPDQSKVTVELQPDAKWSDGKPLTADDIKVSAAVAFTQGAGAFAINPGASGGLSDVKVLGDKKVEFDQVPNAKNNTFLRGVLTMYVLPKSVFGSQLPADVWDTIKTATGQSGDAKTQKSAQAKLTALGKKLVAYGPKKDVSAGPFVLQSINPGSATLVKNRYFYDADKITVQKVVLKNYSGNEQIWNYLIAGQLDAAPYTSTPTNVVKKILARDDNHEITGFSPVAASLAFDQHVAPFGNVHVRRGLAYAIDRDQVTKIGEPESGTASKSTSGLIQKAADAQIGSAAGNLPQYAHNPAQAAKEFQQAGLKKSGGKWRLANGKPWSFSITVPSGFTDWLAGAKSISSQLQDLGVDAKVSTVADYPTYLAEIAEGKYACGFWLIALGPSNFNAYQRLYGASNGWTTVGNKLVHNSGKGSGNWMNGTESETVGGLGKIDPGELTYQLSQLSADEQKPIVRQLAEYSADQLPVIQLWDYTNVQFVNTKRFTDFPPNDSDVLRRSPGVWMQLGYIQAR